MFPWEVQGHGMGLTEYYRAVQFHNSHSDPLLKVTGLRPVQVLWYGCLNPFLTGERKLSLHPGLHWEVFL